MNDLQTNSAAFSEVSDNVMNNYLLSPLLKITYMVKPFLSALLRSNGGRLCFAIVYLFIFFIHRSFPETTPPILIKFQESCILV